MALDQGRLSSSVRRPTRRAKTAGLRRIRAILRESKKRVYHRRGRLARARSSGLYDEEPSKPTPRKRSSQTRKKSSPQSSKTSTKPPRPVILDRADTGSTGVLRVRKLYAKAKAQRRSNFSSLSLGRTSRATNGSAKKKPSSKRSRTHTTRRSRPRSPNSYALTLAETGMRTRSQSYELFALRRVPSVTDVSIR